MSKKGKIPFRNPKNWKQRLANAAVRGRFTREDCERAECWNRCAVGEIFQIRVRGEYPDEMKEQLRNMTFSKQVDEVNRLGYDFYYRVAGDDVELATTLYCEIEKIYEQHEKKEAVDTFLRAAASDAPHECALPRDPGGGK